MARSRLHSHIIIYSYKMSEILLLSSDEITGLPASRIPFCRKPIQVHPYRHVLWRNIHHLEQIFAHIDTVLCDVD